MTKYTLSVLKMDFSILKLKSAQALDLDAPYTFFARTQEEISLACPTSRAPTAFLAREDGWRALRVAGVLDFSLTGILSGIATSLANAGVGLFAISTYDTDYILVRGADLGKALRALRSAGYAAVD